MKGSVRQHVHLWQRSLPGILVIFMVGFAAPEERPCVADYNCPAERFCTGSSVAPLLPIRGTCVSCWQCCLLPGVFSAATCSSRCGCAASQPCWVDTDCGPGEFCAVLRSRSELPTCQTCVRCTTHSLAWSGSCASACPSAALEDNAVAEAAAAQYVFAAFAIREHPVAAAGMALSPEDGVVRVTEAALLALLGDLPPHFLGALVPAPVPAAAAGAPDVPAAGMRGGQQARVTSLAAFAERLAAFAPTRDLLCPQLPAAVVPAAAAAPPPTTSSPAGTAAAASTAATFAAAAAATVPAGCPCNATAAATNFRCPAGHRCSPRAWLSLPADLVTLGGTALLQARCEPCPPGSYCPEGTFVEEQDSTNYMAVLSCPGGHYCPTPAELYECPAGSYCPTGMTTNITCEYTSFLSAKVLPAAGSLFGDVLEDLLERLVRDREPLRGNHCANGSWVPDQSCRAGYYCPDPSLELLCPPGHYCRAESIAPVACPPLTLCGAGSGAPAIWPAVVAIFCGLALSVLVMGLIVAGMDTSNTQALRSKADQDKRSGAARTMWRFIARFNGGHITPATRSVWRVQPRKLELTDVKWAGPGRGSGQPVLEGVTGVFEPGHLSAILGPSGCGKSSLLALLAGRATHWPLDGGEVRVNGAKVTNPGDLKRVTGFVPQDDILCSELTVQENLKFSAALRLPHLAAGRGKAPDLGATAPAAALPRPPSSAPRLSGPQVLSSPPNPVSSQMVQHPIAPTTPKPSGDLPIGGNEYGSTKLGASHSRLGGVGTAAAVHSGTEERRLLIEEVLGMLDLKMLRNQRVGSISDRSLSGGQRKRVNIGVELVARPPVLLLDEPTSGLDATCSSDVLLSLFDMAGERLVNVIMVVHQPRRAVYELFDKVVLLNRQGASVYYGDARMAQSYFVSLGYSITDNENVADRILDIVMGKCYNRNGISSNELSDLLRPSSSSSRVSSSLPAAAAAAAAAAAVPSVSLRVGLSSTPNCSSIVCPGHKGSKMIPNLTEELQLVIEEEYDMMLGPGAARNGGMLDRRGLLRMLRHLGHEGPQVEDFVQGILEEATRRRQREPPPQQQQADVCTDGGSGMGCCRKDDNNDVNHLPADRAPSLQHQQHQQHQPRQQHAQHQKPSQQPDTSGSAAAALRHSCALRRATSGRSNGPTLRPFRLRSPSGRRALYWVPGPPLAATVTELLEALDLIQDNRLTVQTLEIRPSEGVLAPQGRVSARTSVVKTLGDTLLSAANSLLLRPFSSLLRSAHSSQQPRQQYQKAPSHQHPPQLQSQQQSQQQQQQQSQQQQQQQQDQSLAAGAADLRARSLGAHTWRRLLRKGLSLPRLLRRNSSAAEQPDPSCASRQRRPPLPDAAAPIVPRTSGERPAALHRISGDGPPYHRTSGNPSGSRGAAAHAPGHCGSADGVVAVEVKEPPLREDVVAAQSSGDKAGPPAPALQLPPAPSGPPCMMLPPSPFAQYNVLASVDSGSLCYTAADGFIAAAAGAPPLPTTPQQQQKVPQLQQSLDGSLTSELLRAAGGSVSDACPRIAIAGGSRGGDGDGDDDGAARLLGTAALWGQPSRRQEPSWLRQIWVFTRRASLQSTRMFWPASMLEVALLLAAAAAVGANQGRVWGPTAVPGNVAMAMLCLAVLAVVQHLRTFMTNRLVLQRERGSGLSPSAYFIARCVADVPWIVVAPVFFSLPYYILTVPRAPYMPYYMISMGVWWWASGLSYLVTVTPLIPPAAAPTTAVLLTLIAGAMLNGVTSPTLADARGTPAEVLLSVSYNRWAVEALSVTELEQYLDSHSNVVALIQHSKGMCGLDQVIADDLLNGDLRSAALLKPPRVDGDEDNAPWQLLLHFISGSGPFARGYCKGTFRTALIVLFGLGFALRFIACVTLKYDSRILSFTLALWARLRGLCHVVKRRVQLARCACGSTAVEADEATGSAHLAPNTLGSAAIAAAAAAATSASGEESGDTAIDRGPSVEGVNTRLVIQITRIEEEGDSAGPASGATG